MKDEMIREKIRQAVDHQASDVHPNPFLAQRVIAQATGKEKIIVKKKLSISMLLIIVLLLAAVTGLAIALLSPKEVVEQVAVPLALENDTGVSVQGSYTTEELAELVRQLDENGITLEENNRIIQLLKNDQGYNEEETIMEICRLAFGGNYYTWTLEEQDWFDHLMVDIGFYESYVPRIPGKENMKYEDAEAFAFGRLRQEYGQDLAVEDRTVYQLSRQFYHDIDNGGKAAWSFTLEPLDVTHGQYHIQFSDEDPDGTVFVDANIPDWTKPYTGSQLLNQFHSVYSWSEGTWSQAVWQQLHEMLQNADLDMASYDYTVCRGYQLTEYPEPEQHDITRDEAVRIGKEALHLDRAALNSAVLTEYEGHRVWLVGMGIYQNDVTQKDDEAGEYVIAIDSLTGNVESIRKRTTDDDISFAFVPQTAYTEAWEGILKNSDYIRLAAEAIQKIYPDLDLMNEEEYSITNIGSQSHYIKFRSKVITHGDASATVTSEGTVSEAMADVEPLSGDNIYQRYSSAYGYSGNWNQDTWVMLGQDMETLNPTGYEYLPLKNTRYLRESSVTINHEKAQELAIKASGKRIVEINTCVLVEAEPHPVWIMRLLTDEPDDPVLGIDAETGKVVFSEQFKTDYTPMYVLYSLPETWRKIELQNLGAPYMAKVAITHKFGDMWLDEPELDIDNTEYWEIQQEGLVVRYIGRWSGMDSYEVELDNRGFVLRCEKTKSASTEAKPDDLPEVIGEVIPTPTPLPDGKPWFFGMDFAGTAFWNEMESKMKEYGVTAGNFREKAQEWHQEYGNSDEWPVDLEVLDIFMSQTDTSMLKDNYPMFPHEGKKTRDEIYTLAREAFHQEADGVMGVEWVDQLRCAGMLWSRHINYFAGEQIDEPVWYINMQIFDEELHFWNPKGYVLLNEDGIVLECSLELMGNG